MSFLRLVRASVAAIALISKLYTQNHAKFDRRSTQFRCRTCAQDAREERRLIQNASEAVPCTLALLEMLLQALGACCAPKLRRDSSKISRFQRKITALTADGCKISRQKALLSSRKPAHLVHCASNDRRCLSCVSCAHWWPQWR